MRLDPSAVLIDRRTLTAEQLLERLRGRRLDLTAALRRPADRWDARQQASFVESLLLGVPAPGLFVAETAEQWAVLDGAQQTAALQSFTDGRLTLRGLRYFPHLEDTDFTRLRPGLRTRLLETPIPLTVLRAGAPAEVVREMAERINAGQPKEILL